MDGRWKRLYADEWHASVQRESLVKQLLEDWGYSITYHGFMAGSTVHTPEHPDVKGKPDLEAIVNGKSVMFEVTGTSKHIPPEAPIWVRVDKVEYALSWNGQIWLAHVIPDRVRFHDMKSIAQYPIMTKKPRGVDERYYTVPSKNMLGQDQFREILSAYCP